MSAIGFFGVLVAKDDLIRQTDTGLNLLKTIIRSDFCILCIFFTKMLAYAVSFKSNLSDKLSRNFVENSFESDTNIKMNIAIINEHAHTKFVTYFLIHVSIGLCVIMQLTSRQKN